MGKMLKFLGKAWPALLLTIAFLALQAYCDLALPRYTANIVDVGIQQGGIESPVPFSIRKTRLQELTAYMTGEEQAAVLAAYEPGEKDIETLADPGADLSRPFIRAFLVDALAKGSMPAGVSLEGMEALSSLPEGLDIQKALSMLPGDQRDQVIGRIDEAISALPQSILVQSALPSVQQEYYEQGLDTGAMQNRYILLAGLRMLGMALLGTAAAVAVGFLGSRIAASLGRYLRGQVFGKVVSFSQQEMDSFSTASLMTRTTNDIQQVQMMLVMLVRTVFYAPIIGVGGVMNALKANTSMAWIIALGVVVLLSVVGVLYFSTMPSFKRLQQLIDKLNLVTREILSGLPVIRAFSTQKKEEARFDEASTRLKKTQLFVYRMMSGMMPVMMLVMNGITILIMWQGAHSIEAGAMQVGDMMAFIQYTMQIIMAFLMISMVSVMLPRASVSLRRVGEVLDAQPAIRQPEEPAAFQPELRGQVEFRDVSFRYPGADEDVLSGISFCVKPGQTTAILGGTGSGKSTLVNLIPRFYDATGGELMVDGVNVKHAPLDQLRERIGFVPQKGVLFSGTINSNIRYGAPDIPEDKVKRAAAIAQAAGFIEEKPEGYEEPVSQGGTNVSGGQKQRLAIARAVAKEPEIFVFDDSFSALDYQTDVALRRALRDETAGSTVIIVAQRISTVLSAQQIIVLDEGRIAGKGTHQELMRTCEVYRQIASSQLSKEELEHAR